MKVEPVMYLKHFIYMGPNHNSSLENIKIKIKKTNQSIFLQLHKKKKKKLSLHTILLSPVTTSEVSYLGEDTFSAQKCPLQSKVTSVLYLEITESGGDEPRYQSWIEKIQVHWEVCTAGTICCCCSTDPLLQDLAPACSVRVTKS